VLLPIYLGFLSRVTEEKKRGSAFGSIFSAQCIFGAWAVCCIGFLLAGRVFPKNYAFLFLLTAVAICVGNLFFFPVREPRTREPGPRKRLGEYFRELHSAFREKRLLRKYVFLRLLIALNMLIVFFYVKHAESEFEWLDADHVRYFVVFLLIGQSLGNLIFGRLGDRVGFKAVAAAGAAFMLCAACISVMLRTLPAFYLAMAAAGFYLAADWISHLNIVIQLSDKGKHTRDLGLVGFMTSLPLAGVSLLMGYLIDAVSFGVVAVGSSAVAVLGAVLLLTMKMPAGEAPAERLTRQPH
jgi:predicted MFS family arabinose efflux permease